MKPFTESELKEAEELCCWLSDNTRDVEYAFQYLILEEAGQIVIAEGYGIRDVGIQAYTLDELKTRVEEDKKDLEDTEDEE